MLWSYGFLSNAQSSKTPIIFIVYNLKLKAMTNQLFILSFDFGNKKHVFLNDEMNEIESIEMLELQDYLH